MTKKSSKQGRESNIITHPAHYIAGRVFQPISVIEEFGLCHHLACAVKYIARAGRKTSTLNDLKKAEWYLDRELNRIRAGMGPCVPPLKIDFRFKILAVGEDWGLFPHLREALSCLLKSRQEVCPYPGIHWIRRHFQPNNPKKLLEEGPLLVEAMDHLRLAISECEQGGRK